MLWALWQNNIKTKLDRQKCKKEPKYKCIYWIKYKLKSIHGDILMISLSQNYDRYNHNVF